MPSFDDAPAVDEGGDTDAAEEDDDDDDGVGSLVRDPPRDPHNSCTTGLIPPWYSPVRNNAWNAGLVSAPCEVAAVAVSNATSGTSATRSLLLMGLAPLPVVLLLLLLLLLPP